MDSRQEPCRPQQRLFDVRGGSHQAGRLSATGGSVVWATFLARGSIPLSRWSCAELARELEQCHVVEMIPAWTVWRVLHADVIRPVALVVDRQRDPNFAQKAAVALDLYAVVFDGVKLGVDEFVICANESLRSLNMPAPTTSSSSTRLRRPRPGCAPSNCSPTSAGSHRCSQLLSNPPGSRRIVER